MQTAVPHKYWHAAEDEVAEDEEVQAEEAEEEVVVVDEEVVLPPEVWCLVAAYLGPGGTFQCLPATLRRLHVKSAPFVHVPSLSLPPSLYFVHRPMHFIVQIDWLTIGCPSFFSCFLFWSFLLSLHGCLVVSPLLIVCNRQTDREVNVVLCG